MYNVYFTCINQTLGGRSVFEKNSDPDSVLFFFRGIAYIGQSTICPRSLDPLYIVSYYIKWVSQLLYNTICTICTNYKHNSYQPR